MSRTETVEIKDGIEWFSIDGDPNNLDCQCARCGSSCNFLDCWNCDHGYVEKDFGDDCMEDLHDVPCEFCKGTGGHWHCISGPEWCNAHPLKGRVHIESSALSSEAWNE